MGVQIPHSVPNCNRNMYVRINISMDYKQHYDTLIHRAKHRALNGYKELHHIIPRCIGGNNCPTNLVYLTAREHFIAHLLLVKMYPETGKLVYAAMMMCVANKDHRRITSNRYEWLKKKYSKEVSKNQSGIKNSQYGKVWIYNDILESSKRIDKHEAIPEGWNLGRKMSFDVHYCPECNNTVLDRNKLYCSQQCKKYNRSPHFRIIDDNIDEMILVFEKTKSIDRTLRHFNIVGNRKGNSYFSKILKSKGYSILRRRNSASEA